MTDPPRYGGYFFLITKGLLLTIHSYNTTLLTNNLTINITLCSYYITYNTKITTLPTILHLIHSIWGIFSYL